MTVRCIDIETTGIDPAKDAVVEIASVDLLREGGITNCQNTLVRPALPVPPEASAVHHLIDADLVEAPSLEDVIGRFKGADAYVAHNCEFERSFLGDSSILPLGSARTNARSEFGRTLPRTAIRHCATR
jgi:exodeoxyribonuclease X